jgi:very-long-chain (3R)-3-hydroxyacyl-CoA dehydratase
VFCPPLARVIPPHPYPGQELGLEPYPVKWLRYSAFLPLYPLGVASELTMAYLALPAIRERRPWSVALPNPANFGFDYYTACWIIIALYLPGGWRRGCLGQGAGWWWCNALCSWAAGGLQERRGLLWR